MPFSLAYTFIALDQAFHGSKFILTIRNSSEEWYNSVINFAGKIHGKGNIPPTIDDLKKSEYIYKGRAYHVYKNIHQITGDNLYDRDMFIEYYESHNNIVKDYFRHRPQDLLILNVAEKDSFPKLCNFLNVTSEIKEFPWENKTDVIGSKINTNLK